MKEPKIAEKRPAVLDLEPRTYFWCACGGSKSQPFCDGTHKGSGFAPVKLEVSHPNKVALCQCKHTANPPMCDGTHRSLK